MPPEIRAGAVDTRRADAAYKSFPSFAAWLDNTAVDSSRWERYASLLQQRQALTPELLARARDVAKRAAAVDTGAIEGLYEVDRGFTFSVAMQMAAWEAQLDSKGLRVRALIEAQMSAYDFVLDFATRSVPFAEAGIRTLHEVMCKGQETYAVQTEVGIQEQPLPLGRYKVLPNHVLKADNQIHSYAPDLVPAEMQRLCAAFQSDSFLAAHPVHQAAYAHYGLVAIHPFADGNGRVARALASVFTYRALSVPIVILAEHRLEYYDALADADRGDCQPFTDFMLTRALDSIQLVSETLKAAGVPAPLEAAASLKRIYLTRGGFTHGEIDAAGHRLFEAFMAELTKQTNQLVTNELSIKRTSSQTEFQPKDPNYRTPITLERRVVTILFTTSPPAEARLERHITLEVPRDPGREDDIVLRCLETDEAFQARTTEAHPAITGTVQLRLSVFVQGLLGRAVDELSKLAAAELRQQGY